MFFAVVLVGGRLGTSGSARVPGVSPPGEHPVRDPRPTATRAFLTVAAAVERATARVGGSLSLGEPLGRHVLGERNPDGDSRWTPTVAAHRNAIALRSPQATIVRSDRDGQI